MSDEMGFKYANIVPQTNCPSCGAQHVWLITRGDVTTCFQCDPVAKKYRKEHAALKDERLTAIARKAFLLWAEDQHASEEAAVQIWDEYPETRERWGKIVAMVAEEVLG